MSDRELTKVIEMLLDQSASARQRAAAARRLARSRSEGALGALVAVARDQQVEEALARVAGESVAKVLMRNDDVDSVPLEDFTGAAYLGYDAAVGKHMRRLSHPSRTV